MRFILKIGHILLVVVFFLCITIPGILSDKTGGKVSLEENRYLAQAPVIFQDRGINWRDGELITDIDAWIGDNAFGREKAKKLLSLFHVSILHDRTEGQTLIADDWLFLWRDALPARAQHTNLLNEERKDELVKKSEEIYDALRMRNVEFCATLFPHKLDICSIFLPEEINIDKEKCLTQQLEEIFGNQDKFIVTSCYDQLKNSIDKYIKGQGPLTYYKAFDGSHWNWNGAFIGYSTMMNTIKARWPDLLILEKSDYEIKPNQLLTEKYGKRIVEEDTSWARKMDRESQRDDSILEALSVELRDPWNVNRGYRNSQGAGKPKALIIGDSYLWMFFLDDIAESFSEMIYINIEDADSMFTLVDRFEPSIVAYAGINFQTFVDLVEIPEIQGEL